MVRAKDKIFRMSDLKGKKIGITKSMNTLKNDWWRIQEHQGHFVDANDERHDGERCRAC